MENFRIDFGMLAPTLLQQVKKQKLKCDKQKMKDFQDVRIAIMQLNYWGYSTEAIHSKMKRRLFNKISSHVSSKNKGVKISLL